MERRRRIPKLHLTRRNVLSLALGLALCISLGANVYLGVQRRRLHAQVMGERQRELTDVVAAMADIEVNLQKLLIASGAAQSAQLLGETALLAQHVESGLSLAHALRDSAERHEVCRANGPVRYGAGLADERWAHALFRRREAAGQHA